MQNESADPRMPEPSEGNLGRPEGHRTSPLNNGVLEKFAQNMTENIIQSFLGQMEMVEPEVVSNNQNQEMLAEELASAVVKEALREAGFILKSFQSEGMEMDGGQTKSSDESESEPCNPSLSKSGLPVLGSVDYPDAPPTTPLLPELERSRYSFAKKLKGGLAKVFLPSPPPPTPKDEIDSASDPRVELLEHLMHSLSSDDVGRGHFDAEANHGTTVGAFAEALSYDIMDSVLRSTNGDPIHESRDLHELAQQMAETIITSSLDEAKIIV